MKAEIKPLTGIRGIAAIWVLLLHFQDELNACLPWFKNLEPVASRGHIGVDIFFVLSGFIMSYVYQDIYRWQLRSKINFVIKRFARVYPNQLMTLLVLGVLVLAANFLGKSTSGSYELKEFVTHLFMLQAFPYLHNGLSWNYPAWSVSAEFFGYLAIFPIAILLMRQAWLSKYSFSCSIALIIGYLTFLNNELLGTWEMLAQISFEFLAGALLFRSIQQQAKIADISAKAMPYLCITGVILLYLPDSIISDSLVRSYLILTAPLLIAALYSQSGVIANFLSTKYVCYLGLISYALYMTHAITQNVLKVIFPIEMIEEASLTMRLFIFASYIMVPFIVAILTYHFWEEPMRKWLQKKLMS